VHGAGGEHGRRAARGGGAGQALGAAELAHHIHQPLGGTQGQTTDIEIYTREMVKMREQLNGILAKHTGRTIEQITKDTDRNYFMSVEESKEYGLIDEIIEKRR